MSDQIEGNIEQPQEKVGYIRRWWNYVHPRKAIGTPMRGIRIVKNDFRNMASGLKGVRQGAPAQPISETDGIAQFEEWSSTQTADEIHNKTTVAKATSWVYGIGTIGAFCTAGFTLKVGSALGLFAAIGVMAVCVSGMLIARHAVYKLEAKRMITFAQFMARYDIWFKATERSNQHEL